jgi:hypothetical protein
VLDLRLATLLCKKFIAAKSRDVKTGCNLSEFSKEGYGSKRAVFSSDDDHDDYETIIFH